jgi:hypothetical protein
MAVQTIILPMKNVICLPLLFLIGCASQYVGGYYYYPHPGTITVPATQPTQPSPVTTLATVVGVRYPDEHLPLSVEVRLRLDNKGAQPITFDPRSLELTSADLMRFLPAIVTVPTPLIVSPGQSVLIDAEFPFPDSKTYESADLDSLHLSWLLQVGSRSEPQAMDFHREDYYPRRYYDPYWDGPYAYPYPVFGGVWVVHRR